MFAIAASRFISSPPRRSPSPRARRRFHDRRGAVPNVKPISLISTLKVGDGVLAGDIGFDPLGLGDTSEKLTFYREAEVKHARLAMLAAAGWPVAELLNGKLSAFLGVPSLLTHAGE